MTAENKSMLYQNVLSSIWEYENFSHEKPEIVMSWEAFKAFLDSTAPLTRDLEQKITLFGCKVRLIDGCGVFWYVSKQYELTECEVNTELIRKQDALNAIRNAELGMEYEAVEQIPGI